MEIIPCTQRLKSVKDPLSAWGVMDNFILFLVMCSPLWRAFSISPNTFPALFPTVIYRQVIICFQRHEGKSVLFLSLYECSKKKSRKTLKMSFERFSSGRSAASKLWKSGKCLQLQIPASSHHRGIGWATQKLLLLCLRKINLSNLC